MPEWRERAEANGLHEWRLGRICRSFSTAERPDWDTVFQALEGPEGLTRERSAFGRRDVVQALSASARQGVTVSSVLAAADAFLSRRDVVRLLGVGDSEPRYSTVELLAIESRVLDEAARLRRCGRGLASTAQVEAALARRPFLAEEQRGMVRRLAADGDGIAVVIGRAGTGKTTALAAARDAWHTTGLPVRGCAIARKAARELEQKAGLPSTSVAALLRRPRRLEPRTVLIVDQAGMLGTRDLDRLLSLVRDAQGKLVLAGDASQLPAIEAGGALGTLSNRLDPIVLRENRRQHHAWEREAVEAVRVGDADRALDLYEAHGRIHIGRSDDEVLRKLVADWHSHGDPDETLMIAHRRADVRELNGRARALMRVTGQLGNDELLAGGTAFAVGDRVIVKRNDSRCDVRNGDRGVVEHVDLARGSLRVRVGEDLAELDASFLSQPTRAGRPSLDHGYAITAYAAQGQTCRHALVLARDDEWIYTTMTRATQANRLYVVGERSRGRDRQEFAPDEPAKDGRVLLAAALARTHVDEMAIEQLLPERDDDRSIGRGL